MNLSVQAVYEDGVFKPLCKLDLDEHQRVQLTVHTLGAQMSECADGGDDPLRGLHTPTGIADLAANFDDYRFGRRRS